MASPALKSAHPLKTTPKGRRLRELYTPNHSAVHRIDARVKVIFTLAFIVFLNLTPSGAWPAYILFFTWMFSLSLSSRLGIAFVLKRSLLALPFVLAALPLVFTGPAPLGHISVLNAPPLTYSVVGFYRFASIAIKAWVSVMAAVLLAATTRFPDLLTAFSQLKVPTLFITIIGLMWRYLFVISDEVTRMLRARTSRSATAPGSNRSGGSLFWRARVTGGMAGSLFLRSIERSDRVYAAMLSRGYTGQPAAQKTTRLQKKDLLALAAGVILLVLLWLLGVITGG